MTSSLSYSSLPSSLSSSSISDLDTILEAITHHTQAARYHEAERNRALDALASLVENGEAEETQTYNNFKISRRIRKSYTYPEHIIEQRNALKASERLSLALGEATVTTTSHWEVRSINNDQ